MTVVDKPRPKKRARAAVQRGEEITPNTLTAFCSSENRYTPLLNYKRVTVGTVVKAVGECACGASTWRIGGAGSGDGDSIA